jgi:hypothetical protein
MNTSDTGKPKLPDGTAAFNAIIKDIGVVFHLDYRHATFKKWHQVAGTALDMFLGPMHPKTLEFQALPFKHAETPETPEGNPVPEDDELTYSASLETTKGILEFALNECRECDEAEARRLKRLKDAPPAPAEAPPMEIHIIRSNTPGGSVHFDVAGSAKPHEMGEAEIGENPAGEMKIVARTGATGALSLENFAKGLDDPKERELVTRLREVVDDPGSSWSDVKMVLEEIMDARRETALRLLPIIVKR